MVPKGLWCLMGLVFFVGCAGWTVSGPGANVSRQQISQAERKKDVKFLRKVCDGELKTDSPGDKHAACMSLRRVDNSGLRKLSVPPR